MVLIFFPETRQEQLAHIQEQNTIIGTSENPSEPATGAHANAGAAGGAAASGQPNAASNAVAVSNAAAEAGEAGKAEAELSVETQKFLAFAETHRTVLNQILRQSTVHLADGPFSVLVDHTRVLDFINQIYLFLISGTSKLSLSAWMRI